VSDRAESRPAAIFTSAHHVTGVTVSGIRPLKDHGYVREVKIEMETGRYTVTMFADDETGLQLRVDR
jgi:hypothetical protein